MKTLENKTPEAIPPFILFGAIEANPETSPAISYYDPISQKSIYPYGMGSDKKVTKSAKNVGSLLFPKYKNTNDDAKEK
jgi:hypothetical protein